MPLFQHRERGFRLHEDAYLRRCASGEFSLDDFFPYEPPAVESAAEPASSPEPELEIIIEEQPLTGPPTAALDEDDEPTITRPAPRKRR